MKLSIKETLDDYEEYNEGVRRAWDKEHYVFDFEKDLEKDIILLNRDTAGKSVANNLTYYYGYKFNPKCSNKEQELFRDNLKHKIGNKSVFYSQTAEKFVETGLFRMDELKSLRDFGVVISTSNSYNEQTLTGLMCQICWEYINDSAKALNMRLLKKMCNEVTFDENRAREALRKTERYGHSEEAIESAIQSLKNQFEQTIQEGGLFKMKRYKPVAGRAGFIDFLKFANSYEQETYESLKEGTEVLVCDDFLTAGSTVSEVIRFLTNINPNNKISVFILIDQQRHT